jgi:hypothetical protein
VPVAAATAAGALAAPRTCCGRAALTAATSVTDPVGTAAAAAGPADAAVGEDDDVGPGDDAGAPPAPAAFTPPLLAPAGSLPWPLWCPEPFPPGAAAVDGGPGWVVAVGPDDAASGPGVEEVAGGAGAGVGADGPGVFGESAAVLGDGAAAPPGGRGGPGFGPANATPANRSASAKTAKVKPPTAPAVRRGRMVLLPAEPSM